MSTKNTARTFRSSVAHTADVSTPLDVVASLFAGHNPASIAELLPLAQSQLPKVLAGSCNALEVSEATRRMVCSNARRRRYVRLVEALERQTPGPMTIDVATIDAIGAMSWLHAEAGFALGLALGVRLMGGAAR